MLFNQSVLIHIFNLKDEAIIYDFSTHKKYKLDWKVFLYIKILSNKDDTGLLSKKQIDFLDSKINELYKEGILVQKGGVSSSECSRFIVQEKPLLKLEIELTKNCNFECKHCFNKYEGINHEISYSMLEDVIDEFLFLGGREITLTGGEPLLYSKFHELILLLSSKKIPFVLYTNGWYLNEEMIEFLSKSTIVNIQFSLDGNTSEMHDSFRGKIGSFKRVMDICEYIDSMNMPYSFAVSLNKNNIQNIDDMRKFFSKLNKKVTFDYIICQGNAKDNYEEIGIRNEEYVEAVYEDLKKIGVIEIDKFCGFNDSLIYLNTDGFLKLCSSLPNKYNIGNIEDISLKESWMKIEQMGDQYNCRDLEKCKYKKYCAGGCRSRAYYYENNIYGKDYIMCCFFEKFYTK